ncbi:MAG: deoxynucleoside kinase [Pseudomonadota bacterium]
MSNQGSILELAEAPKIKRHQIPHRLTTVVRRLMKYFSRNRCLITCVGNIGAGKSSLIKVLAFNTGMNAMFELPDEGFEDHFVQDESFSPLLGTAKDSAKRTLGRYYGAIDDFIRCQAREAVESPAWMIAKRNLEKGALDIQHSYLDLRRMQLQVAANLNNSTCIDGTALADRYAFCEVLHRDMDVSYLTRDDLHVIDRRLDSEFRSLPGPSLLVVLHGPLEYLFQNIRERQRDEEKGGAVGQEADIPEGVARLVRALNTRYDEFVDVVRDAGWYTGPVLKIDVSKIDFVSKVRHLIAVYEGIEKLLVPEDFVV